MRARWRAALLYALPLVLVKEDLGLTTAALAVVVAVRARRVSPVAMRWALAVAAFGAVATLVTLTAVIPAFNTTGGYDYWSKVGGKDAAGPWTAWHLKLRTLTWILLPTTGLLALRSPLLLAALPTLAWRFLSSDDHYWSTDWHYSAVLMPIVMLALADAVATARHSPHAWLRAYAPRLPLCAAVAALALTPSMPLGALTEPATYRRSPQVSRRRGPVRADPGRGDGGGGHRPDRPAHIALPGLLGGRRASGDTVLHRDQQHRRLGGRPRRVRRGPAPRRPLHGRRGGGGYVVLRLQG